MNPAEMAQLLTYATDTRSITIGSGTLAAVSQVFGQQFPQQAAILVADTITFAVAGRAVLEDLRSNGVQLAEPFIFPGEPTLHADYRHVTELREHLKHTAAIVVAVGSGTINDIAKLASHECGRPYMVVATAASMDGYVSFGASITRDGYKQTFSCPAPRALVADVAILAAAPKAMTASGYADMLGKVPAGADWILADALGVEQINPTAWHLVQSGLRRWIGRPEALAGGDPDATSALIEGLVMSGIGMQAAQSSRPASGAEHQFSHLWEMGGLAYNGKLVSHGFKVGIGSLAVASLYADFLQQDLSELNVAARCAAWPARETVAERVRRAHSSPFLAEKAVEMTLAKYITPEQLKARLTALKALWPEVREKIKAQLLPAPELRRMLRAAGCPSSPAEIGVSLAELKASYQGARHIRTRYTVLDTAEEAGLLDPTVDRLFSPGGFWG